jgi:hypothetical protein
MTVICTEGKGKATQTTPNLNNAGKTQRRPYPLIFNKKTQPKL